jgi:quercetin dioxygenase-like cupin family protein
MHNGYSFIPNILDLVKEIPPDTIVSRTYYEDDQIKSILFGFAEGQELSEHTASKPAILHFLTGEADVTLGEDPVTAQEGTWIHMPANLSHSVVAKTPVVMLLLLFG